MKFNISIRGSIKTTLIEFNISMRVLILKAHRFNKTDTTQEKSQHIHQQIHKPELMGGGTMYIYVKPVYHKERDTYILILMNDKE